MSKEFKFKVGDIVRYKGQTLVGLMDKAPCKVLNSHLDHGDKMYEVCRVEDIGENGRPDLVSKIWKGFEESFELVEGK